MNKFLLFLLFFVFQISYSHTGIIEPPIYTDTLVKNTATNKKLNLNSGKSNSFIDELEKKFPEVKSNNHSSFSGYSAPEFTWQNLKAYFPSSATIKDQRGVAKYAFTAIEAKGLWTDNFSNEDIVSLPIGVKKTVGNVEYSIGIINAEVGPEFTTLTAFARVTIQQSNENGEPIELFFGANNVKLSHQGGIIGEAKLVLLGDMHIPFNGGNWLIKFNGGLDYQTGLTQGLTYVTIDCDGVKNLSLNGSVEFSRNLILPINPNGEVAEGTSSNEEPNRVRGDFNLQVEDWNDVIVNISLQPFVRFQKRNGKDYNGNLQFFLNDAILDFSDLRNAPNVKFPDYYHENSLLMPNEETWKGIYVETLEVHLPKEFRDGDQRVSFGAHRLIIDSYGISGTLYGEGLLPIEKGRTSKENGWAYSLDVMEIDLAASHLTGAYFSGRILLPVSKYDQKEGKLGLGYQGLFTDEEYAVKVSTDSVVDFNLWQASGQLEPNSSIEFKVIENQFRPKATLHGNLTISAGLNKSETGAQTLKKEEKTVQFKGIRFQNLVLQSQSPVLSVGYLGYQGEMKLGNFPVSINDISLTTSNDMASLWFGLKLNLMDGAGFGADANIGILAKNVEEDYRQKWDFVGLDISAIGVNADLGPFSIYGSLTLMEDDPEYGNGFSADLITRFGALGNVEIGAKGIFGRVDGYRYWYFDALVKNLGIPGSPGIITPTGFGGGASYKMSRTGFSSEFSPSGLAYKPDENKGLGLKSMILFSAAAKGVIDGSAGFEILFNRSGGISRMGLYGSAKFMDEIPFGGDIEGLLGKVKKDTRALDDYLGKTELGAALNDESSDLNAITKPFLKKAEMDFPRLETKMGVEAIMGVEFDFENSILHGEMDVFVNVARGAVEGRASEGRAGWAVLHFAPNEWYVHMGTPSDRLGLKIGVGPVRVESGGYFMMGDKMPASPPPPPIVAEILGVDAKRLDYMRDENALSDGRGIAFGTDISYDTGDLNFLMFYAKFQAGSGFDIMLKDYGEAVCVNRDGGQIGINGWYANGQGYAYLQGELGINIKLFFVRKKIPIVKGGAAVLLQAKAPNPVWMRGYVGGHFNLLGGLVKGDYRFKLTIGEECELLNASPLAGMKIIADLTPTDGSSDADVFTAPQATFNMKVDQPIVIPEDEGDKTYKIVLEKFRILHNGNEIPGAIDWSSSNDRATYISTDILPPNEPLTVEVEVSFQERINGVYQTVMVDGKKAVEKEERNFTTGKAPTVIPLHNIQYAYPVIDQQYFLQNEHDQGFIQLLRGQDYLFDFGQWTTDIVFSDAEGIKQSVDFNYDETTNKVYYEFPDFNNQTKYRMTILSRSNSSNETEGTLNENNYQTTTVDNGNEISVRQNQAEDVVRSGEVERLVYEFSSSRYNTFKEKVRKINTTDQNWGRIYSDVIFLSNQIQSVEAFDKAELIGTDFTGNHPLVVVEATLDDDYYRKDMLPPLYGKYPLGGKYRVEEREETEYGVPPKKAVPIMSSYLTSVEYGVNSNWLLKTFPYYYNLPLLYKKDWVDLRSQILNDYVKGLILPSNPVIEIIDADFLIMRFGNYTIDLQYELPGGIRGSSEEYEFKNNNRFR